MASVATKADLPPDGVRLIILMQVVNFGRIEGLVVRAGRPVFRPPPRVVREVKFGGANGPRPEASKGNFPLKSQVRELFTHMEALGDAVIRTLEVRHGLPFKMTIEEVCA